MDDRSPRWRDEFSNKNKHAGDVNVLVREIKVRMLATVTSLPCKKNLKMLIRAMVVMA